MAFDIETLHEGAWNFLFLMAALAIIVALILAFVLSQKSTITNPSGLLYPLRALLGV